MLEVQSFEYVNFLISQISPTSSQVQPSFITYFNSYIAQIDNGFNQGKGSKHPPW